MDIRQTIEGIVKAWSHSQGKLDVTEPLQALSANLPGPYYTTTAQLLLGDVLAAYPSEPQLGKDLQITLFYDSGANTTGTIKTTADLADAVEASLTTPTMKVMSFLSAPFRYLARKFTGGGQ
jgi:hypothetical protein